MLCTVRMGLYSSLITGIKPLLITYDLLLSLDNKFLYTEYERVAGRVRLYSMLYFSLLSGPC